MNHLFSGRVPTLYTGRTVALTVLPFLFSLLSGCREHLPSDAREPVDIQFGLGLNNYFIYDNWRLDVYGSRIPSSKFRSSWTVTDTSAVVYGYPHVAIVADSTFARDMGGADSLVRVDYRYFRTAPNGDVFEFGFVAQLLEQRDTILVSAQWDKLLSPSASNSSWVVETADSTVGTVYGSLFPSLEIVGTTIDGVPSGVLAHHVQITGRNLALDLWFSGLPSALLRFRDDSDVEGVRIFQELASMRSGQ
jgi:hypothetical protein